MFADSTAEPVTQAQHAHMHALWREAGVTDRADRLALTGAAVGRKVTTSADLTCAEAARLIDYMLTLDNAGVLAQRVYQYLAALPDRAKSAR